MRRRGKMGKKGQGGLEFEFCGVCRINHNDGRRHVYFPRHKSALSALISRFLSKISDVRFFLRNPSFLRCEDAGRNRFWCAVCGADVDKVDSEFACNAISHLAGSEHLVSLKSFLWKHGAGQDRVDKFRISEEEFSKWEVRCRSMKMGKSLSNANNIGLSKNIHTGISCFDRKSSEKDSERRLEIGASVPSCSGSLGPPNNILNAANSLDMHGFQKPVNHSFETGNLFNGVLPLQRFTHESHQVPYQTGGDGSSGFGSTGQQMIAYMNSQRNREGLGFSSEKMVNKVNGESDSALELYSLYDGAKQGVVEGNSDFMALENLTRLHSVPGDQISNVHSGAPPPWLRANEDIQTTYNPSETGGGTTRSSKTVKSQKRRKPERVGAAWAERRKAELEKEKRGEVATSYLDADWLPNFGRVWQSGSRKESRREFESERRKVLKTENVSSDASVMSFRLQPYISKRMRQDAESCDADSGKLL